MEYENNALIVKVDTDDEYEFARDMQVQPLTPSFCLELKFVSLSILSMFLKRVLFSLLSFVSREYILINYQNPLLSSHIS